jgi:hypothetical protein
VTQGGDRRWNTWQHIADGSTLQMPAERTDDSREEKASANGAGKETPWGGAFRLSHYLKEEPTNRAEGDPAKTLAQEPAQNLPRDKA